MLKRNLKRIMAVTMIVLLMGITVIAQNKDENGDVRIPWDEFRKLLELDKDEFVLAWQDFQKILEQTGFQYVPPYQLKDEKVILTRDQFRNLLNKMKPPSDPDIKPPSNYLLIQAVYTGRILNGSARFRADYDIEIFSLPQNQYVKIPFFPVSIALKDASFDGKKGLVILEGSRHTLITKEMGRHHITLDFSLKAQTKQGPWEAVFPIPKTSITKLEVDIPLKDIEVEITQAQEMEVTVRGNITHVSALISPTETIHLRWRKKPPEVVKGPPKIYSEMTHLLSIEDDAMRIETGISLSILQNSISALMLRVPEDYSILEVQGRGIADWREVTISDTPHLEIVFDYPKEGQLTINITSEKLLPNPSMAVEFEGFAVMESIREKGFLGVALKSTSEITLGQSEGLDKLDVSELPATLINRSQKPLLLGFKYLHHPYSLVLDIKKHEELPVISTVVDSASGVTLFTEDGKLVHRVIYQIRNTSKQFLELELPADAQIWSVFVGGEPAKPRLDQNRILIPLNRSHQGATGLAAFDVELIYFQKADRFGTMGIRKSMFPVPDIIISELLWSVYLPEGYRYVYFGGTVEKEMAARGIRSLLKRKERAVIHHIDPAGAPSQNTDTEAKLHEKAEEAKKQFSQNLGLSKDRLIAQMENELQFRQRVEALQAPSAPTSGGVLPIRINIPATGRLFRFAKTIVSEEPLTLNYRYISDGTVFSIKLGFLLLVLMILWLLRRPIITRLKNLAGRSRLNYLPLLLIAAGIVLWWFSKFLAIVLLIGGIAIIVLKQIKKPPAS
jgi:hypothetical protein